MKGATPNPGEQLPPVASVEASEASSSPPPPEESLSSPIQDEKTEILQSQALPSPPPDLVDPLLAGQTTVGEAEGAGQHLKPDGEEANRLRETVEELQAQLDAMRKDFSAQTADGQLELKTLQSLLERSHEQVEKLQKEMIQQKKANKALKSQNLRLQYHLNVWGIPVSASGKESQVPDSTGEGGRLFFPELSALVDGLDPIPVVLRGDIYTFGFPNLLHFLANSNLTGVLTMVSEGVVSKLYLEKGILRLAGWNHRAQDLSLANLLLQSDLVNASVLEKFETESLYDLELAVELLKTEEMATSLIQSGLREHARVVLTYLYEMEQGAFFFQPGILRRQRYLQFNLAILDLLLVTAAEVDEKSRSYSKH